MTHPLDDQQKLARWRLVLGQCAEEQGITLAGADDQARRLEQTLTTLYQEPQPGRRRSKGERDGGPGPGHALAVPEWVAAVRELFPQPAREVMERELVRRRGIRQLLDQPDLLEQLEPDLELTKVLLSHRELLNPQTRELARRIIDKTVDELKRVIRLQVEPVLNGALRRDRHTPRRVFRNLDLRTTLRRNLHNWDAEREQLLVDRAWFFTAERRQRPWQVVVVVDQSGSMLDSAIHAAVMASIFHQLPALRTSLVLFDTEVVDLTGQVGQPVDVLLQIQLGGGTHIAKALRYARQLIREPNRTLVVLITDFYEGVSDQELIREVDQLTGSGTRLIGLGALGQEARPDYNRHLTRQLVKVGMDLLACTPDQLAKLMARIIGGRGAGASR